MNAERYHIPAEEYRTIIVVENSRFIAIVAHANSVEVARATLARIRSEMPDASHHVYGFRVGYGQSVIEGMSDDGEPSGTAGPPVLAVLRGTNIGDVIVVVTRYFGGIKLGTGGLVRAYSEAARTVLQSVRTEEKVPRKTLGVEVPYTFYQIIKLMIAKHQGTIEDETFLGDVTLIARFPVENIPAFADELRETSAGRIEPIILSDE